jgi:hypothetical protein
MTIQEALKNKGSGIRVTCGKQWMIWDEESFEWVVYKRPSYARESKIIYRGVSESDAIKLLQE